VGNVRLLRNDVQAVYQAGSKTMKLIRAFGEAPITPGVLFNRKRLAYDFTEALKSVKSTPAAALMDRAGKGLKALGLRLPTEELRDRLLPKFDGIDLGTLLPDVAGLDLANLFQGVRLGGAMADRVKVGHGIDEDTRRAWVKADVDLPVGDKTLLSWGPIRVDTRQARIVASAKVEVDADGALRHRRTGQVTADWQVSLGGMELVTFVNTALRFDDAGRIRFDISPQNVRMPGVLRFLTDMISAGRAAAQDAAAGARDALTVEDNGSGFSVRPVVKTVGDIDLPIGVESRLDLSFPDTQTVTSGYANLNLGVAFGVVVDTTEGFDFRLRVGFNLASKEKPFTIVLFILGGAGYVSTLIDYSPGKRDLAARFEVAIYAAASLAISFGPVSGGVYAYLGINASYSNGVNGSLAVAATFILRGDVSVAGIVTASIVVTLSLEYQVEASGEQFLLARGRLSLSIKICWCFRIRVSVGIEYRFKTGDGGRLASNASASALPIDDHLDTLN
jgi:hypothetical protein